MSELTEWDSFYVIVGSAAGALIGLQFVVMTLVAERPLLRIADAADAFATPTINHVCATLLLAVLLRAPWHGIGIPAAATSRSKPGTTRSRTFGVSIQCSGSIRFGSRRISRSLSK